MLNPTNITSTTSSPAKKDFNCRQSKSLLDCMFVFYLGSSFKQVNFKKGIAHSFEGGYTHKSGRDTMHIQQADCVRRQCPRFFPLPGATRLVFAVHRVISSLTSFEHEAKTCTIIELVLEVSEQSLD